MNAKTLWLATAVLIGGLMLSGWTARTQSTTTAWEYKVVPASMPFSQIELNQHATGGWQFVESQTFNDGHQAVLVYKRAK